MSAPADGKESGKGGQDGPNVIPIDKKKKGEENPLMIPIDGNEKGDKKGHEHRHGEPAKKEDGLDDRTRRNLGYSAVEGAFGNADATIRNTYTTPFALSLNATSAEIGLLSSMHTLASTLAQIPGASIASVLGGRKRVWFFSNLMQKFFWIPIILLPLLPVTDKVMALIALVAIGGFFANIRGPAWSSLMADIVPEDRWGRYFGWRNTIINIAALIATLVSAEMLILMGFPAIFSVAIALGLFSMYFFSKIREPHFRSRYHYHHHITLNPKGLMTSIRINRNFAVFTVFMTAMGFAVNVASPFFTVYMLSDMKIGYAWYSYMVVLESLIVIMTKQYWGNLCDRVGDRNIMAVTGILVCFVPFYWLFVDTTYKIVIANGLSGFAWSGFDVATFNFMLAASPKDKRTKFTANYAFFTGFGVVGGAIVGGFLAVLFGQSALLWMHGLQLVFLVAFCLRLLCLLFLPMLKESRVKEEGAEEPIMDIFWHAVAADPARRLTHLILYPTHIDWKREIPRAIRSAIKTIKYKIKLSVSDKF